jgi:hypothetical protein
MDTMDERKCVHESCQQPKNPSNHFDKGVVKHCYLIVTKIIALVRIIVAIKFAITLAGQRDELSRLFTFKII